MKKFDDWPLWLQLLVGIPHGVLALYLVWGWSSLRGRGFYWFVGLVAYVWLFYLVFVMK